MISSMELSLYPLGTGDVGPAVKSFIETLRRHGCEIETGPMSSMIFGESATLFTAVADAYEKACGEGGIVLVMKASNVCLPDRR